jgi:hypothetical protein
MRRLLLLLLVGGSALSGADHQVCAQTFLYQPAYAIDDVLRGPAEVYEPQPGDIYMSTDHLFVAQAGHRLALSGPPHHSGIVFARPDGSMAMLEAGPFNGIWVETLDLDYVLRKHEEYDEKVWIRRRRTPLTPEQSKALTVWATSQDGKRFAVFRLMGQVTVLRSRGPIRTEFMGGPHGERSSYFCSELVMESCVAVGLLNPCDTRPSATYPRDIFFDHSTNRFLNEHMHLEESWYPPARWVSCPAP